MKKNLILSICTFINIQLINAQEDKTLLSFFQLQKMRTNVLIDHSFLVSQDSFFTKYKDVIFSLTPHEVNFEQTVDVRANQMVNIDQLQNGIISDYILDGENIEIAIYDQGKVYSDHNEFRPLPDLRIFDLEPNTLSLSPHTTAVCGIIGAEGYYNYNGINSASKGVLPKSIIKHAGFSQTVNGDRFSKMILFNNYISNHSYSTNNGWTYGTLSSLGEGYYYSVDSSIFNNPDNTIFGAYNTIDYSFDRLIYSNKNFIVIKAAGNDYGKGPGPNDPKFRWGEFGYTSFSDLDVIPSSNCNNGAYCLSNGSLAKNIIVVGSVNLYNGNSSIITPDNIIKSDFSNVGPRKDGAIKPDLVAVGANVIVLTHSGPTWMEPSSGTSFSTPIVTGIIGSLTQLKRLLLNDENFNFRADEIKALLTHTTMEAGNFEGPDNWYGWGLIDAKAAAEFILAADEGLVNLEKKTKISGEDYEKIIVANPNEKIKVTLSWIDPAAVPLSSTSDRIEDVSSKIINDFDLRIVDTVTNEVFFPWKLNLNDVTGAAIKGDNTVDNIEQITINNPIAGRAYKVIVSNKGNLINELGLEEDQNYVLLTQGGTEHILSNNIIDKKIELNIYPTWVENFVNIETDLQLIEVNIFEISGKLIQNYKEKKIDLSYLKRGVYIINIRTEKGVYSKKIVKK